MALAHANAATLTSTTAAYFQRQSRTCLDASAFTHPGPGYPSSCAWARECEARRHPNAGLGQPRITPPLESFASNIQGGFSKKHPFSSLFLKILGSWDPTIKSCGLWVIFSGYFVSPKTLLPPRFTPLYEPGSTRPRTTSLCADPASSTHWALSCSIFCPYGNFKPILGDCSMETSPWSRTAAVALGFSAAAASAAAAGFRTPASAAASLCGGLR